MPDGMPGKLNVGGMRHVVAAVLAHEHRSARHDDRKPHLFHPGGAVVMVLQRELLSVASRGRKRRGRSRHQLCAWQQLDVF